MVCHPLVDSSQHIRKIMQSVISNRVVTSLIALVHIVTSIVVLLPTSAIAQAVDAQPPVIETQLVSRGFRGEGQVFTATVTDDIEVASVTLNYRLDPNDSFDRLSMESLGATGDIFSATVATTESTSVIQYYIEATDVAGNRTLQGFAFDPVERELIDRPVQVTEAAAEEVNVTSGISTGRKVLYGVLGLIVVGALASASGGGGGGSMSGGQTPVTIQVEQLP